MSNTRLAALAAAAAVGVCAQLPGAAPAAPVRSAVPAYPSSLAVIGHSGATGYDSDPVRARWSHNSWVTGDNPLVKSLYARILARNPAVRGHKFNLAINGSNVASLLLQARKAVTMKPTPELVVVQSIDNDIACDGTDAKRLKPFGATFSQALDALATGAPDARIFVVSQFGSPGTSVRALTAVQRKGLGGGSGPCDFLDATGAILPKRLAYLESVIHGYEAAVAASCKLVAACRYDGGAFGRVVDRPEYVSSDLNHFSVKGHAKAAAVAWAALKRVGIIPAD